MSIINKNLSPDINTDVLKTIRFLSHGSKQVKIHLAKKYIRLLIASTIQSYLYRSNDKEWQISCEIILSLLYENDSAKELDRSIVHDLSLLVSRMQQKAEPLALLFSTLVSERLSGKRSDRYDSLDSNAKFKIFKDINDETFGQIDSTDSIQSNTLLRPLYLSIFAAIWGNARWFIASHKFNLVPEARNLFFSQMHIGKHMFYLFTADYLLLRAYRILSPESNDLNVDKIKDIEENLLKDNSLSVAAQYINDFLHKTPYLNNNLLVSLPLIHNFLFITGCTWMIVRYKYVVLPILFAFKLKRDDSMRAIKEKMKRLEML